MLVVQHWIDQEILRNKYPAHCNHSFFIYVFQFDFECTTYTIIRIPAHDVAKVNIHVKYGHGIGKVGGLTHARQLTYLQA
jgi:hypothetical protein